MGSFICDTDKCSGCYACYSICPKQSIEMRVDAEGFLQPHIDSNRCLNCGKCRAVCPILNKYTVGKRGEAYAAINMDEKTRLQSSSGGVFTSLAEHVISCGGVVFGAAFDETFNVKHIMVDSIGDLHKLRGSKYVQSRIDDAYICAQKILESGMMVLFTGTPCQISGLKAFLGKEYTKLITQDIICHGVPSPMIWQKYLQYRQAVQRSEIDYEIPPAFRNKATGWHNYSMKMYFKDGTEYTRTLNKDLFMKAFLKNLSLRRSCYQCHFKSLERESDLTLADFWGGEQQTPEMCDNKGTSLVLIHTDKGAKLFTDLKLKKVELDYEKATLPNVALYKSCDMPKQRDSFIRSLSYMDFGKAVRKYGKTKVKVLINRNIRRIGGKVRRFIR